MLNRGLDKQELLRIVEAVANEKSIDKELVIGSMESAIQKAEQEPKNLEMYMLIEHLAGEIETIQKEIQESRYNKVNIDHLKEQVDMLQKKLNGSHQ